MPRHAAVQLRDDDTDLCHIDCVSSHRAAMTTRFIDQAVHVNPVLFCAGRDNLENQKIKPGLVSTALKMTRKVQIG
jgi:hypothetical protein